MSSVHNDPADTMRLPRRQDLSDGVHGKQPRPIRPSSPPGCSHRAALTKRTLRFRELTVFAYRASLR
jgi:hypothetical protein